MGSLPAVSGAVGGGGEFESVVSRALPRNHSVELIKLVICSMIALSNYGKGER